MLLTLTRVGRFGPPPRARAQWAAAAWAHGRAHLRPPSGQPAATACQRTAVAQVGGGHKSADVLQLPHEPLFCIGGGEARL